MTNNLIVIDTRPTNQIEEDLARMKEIKSAIKALEAEFDMLKKQLIDDYFINHPEYLTAKGQLLASYKAIESARFQADEFKKDFPDIYENYKKKVLSYTFLLK